MTSGLLILFHFLTFTFGFTALILISRRNSSVSSSVRKTFINQALFYNLTIIFMTVADIIVLASGKEMQFNKSELIFFSAMVNLNNLFSILWCLTFVLLIYKLLEITINKKIKIVLSFFCITFLLFIAYNFIGTVTHDLSYLQDITSEILCLTVVFVLGYSVYLYRKSVFIKDGKRRKAMKAFGVLFIGFSLITVFFYIDLIHLKVLSPLMSKVFIYCIDFIYNSIIVFWSCKYFDSLGTATEPIDLKNISEDQIIVKFQISKREQEIIQLVCSGKSNQEIADILFISLGTVKNHLYNIYTKLGIKNRTQLVKIF